MERRKGAKTAKRSFSPYLAAALLLTVVSIVYWSLFSLNAYNTFHEYNDLAIFSYNMYLYSHFPQIAHGLQLLVYGNHIAPDMLLLLPLYRFLSSSLTLLFIQALAVSLTGLALFFITKDMLGNEALALAFCFAFLVSPAVHSLLVFDFHVEAFVPLFYLLTFYYLMKNNKSGFYVFLFLLLGTIEISTLLALTLAIGVMIFEITHDKDASAKRSRMRLAKSMAVISVIVFVAYAMITTMLTNSYATYYPQLPKQLYISSGSQNSLGGNIAFIVHNFSNYLSIIHYSYGLVPPIYVIYGVAIVLLLLGISALFVPLTTLILLLPWVAGALISNQTVEFLLTWYQYVGGFAVGPAIVAGILGASAALNKKDTIYKSLDKMHLDQKRIILFSAIAFSIIFLILSPFFVRSRNLDNLARSFLFVSNEQQAKLYSQLAYVVNAIPQNASVMTQLFVGPHLSNRRYFETLTSNESFTPEYVLVDFNLNISLNALANAQYEAFAQRIRSNAYYLYMQNGTATLYKLKT